MRPLFSSARGRRSTFTLFYIVPFIVTIIINTITAITVIARHLIRFQIPTRRPKQRPAARTTRLELAHVEHVAHDAAFSPSRRTLHRRVLKRTHPRGRGGRVITALIHRSHRA